MIKNILFDLDGTLLPMDQKEFVYKFIAVLSDKLKTLGHDHLSIINALNKSIDAMVHKEDGFYTNQEFFWQVFTSNTNLQMQEIEPVFTEFYENEYILVKEIVKYNPIIADCISYLKTKNYTLIMATSPVFPAIAVNNRMKWNDINPSDFYHITSFENSRYAKPNKNYYIDLFHTLKLDPKECIMVGNDVIEDGIIEELGVDCYLITDFLINKNNMKHATKWTGSFNDFYHLVKTTF